MFYQPSLSSSRGWMAARPDPFIAGDCGWLEVLIALGFDERDAFKFAVAAWMVEPVRLPTPRKRRVDCRASCRLSDAAQPRAYPGLVHRAKLTNQPAVMGPIGRVGPVDSAPDGQSDLGTKGSGASLE